MNYVKAVRELERLEAGPAGRVYLWLIHHSWLGWLLDLWEWIALPKADLD